jgi:hypothetical protein
MICCAVFAKSHVITISLIHAFFVFASASLTSALTGSDIHKNPTHSKSFLTSSSLILVVVAGIFLRA